MLYRQINGAFVDANDSNEVVKACDPPPIVLFYRILKVRFELDAISKSKPVAGPDDLLLLLVQYWARDEHVFPTEDDRHDAATILLFQSYTGGRPAEFVHSSKGKASEDPLGKQKRPTSIDDRERGEISMTTKVLTLTMGWSTTMIAMLVVALSTTTTSSSTLTTTKPPTRMTSSTKARTRAPTTIVATVATGPMSL
ncbi:hypothetical protein B0J14DRAFT_22861 [Halenospora varia]|nr:hypothetical protein B0J14DRAFT_22861 [Halenospora varia]